MTTRNDLPRARAFLKEHFPRGGRVLCAVSGGLDSMCLLHFLLSQPAMQVTAAHFHHSLRGKFADRDRDFVKDWCRERNIPFVTEQGDTAAFAAEHAMSTEEAARTLRYDFLRRAAREADCCAILTAHHADDNAETVLLHLLRGTGTAGLAGIPAVRQGIYRPFLGCTRRELAAYADACGIDHVEDETNAQQDAARNVLRHQVMPVLHQLNPEAAAHISRTAQIVAGEHETAQRHAKDICAAAEETDSGVRLELGRLRQLSPTFGKRAVLALLERAAGARKDLSAAHAEAVWKLAEKGTGSCTLPYGLQAYCETLYLYVERRPIPQGETELSREGSGTFGNWQVLLSAVPQSGAVALSIPRDARISVGPWDSRDRLRTAGTRGSRSVKRLCADAGITPQQRDMLPVLRINGQAAYIPGLGTDMHFAPEREKEPVYVIFYEARENNDEK